MIVVRKYILKFYFKSVSKLYTAPNAPRRALGGGAHTVEVYMIGGKTLFSTG